jgi:inorganic pyrophosphatase
LQPLACSRRAPFTMSSMRRVFGTKTGGISISETGTQPSMEWRMFFHANGQQISPWHDIAMKNADGTYNYVNEIALNQRAKMEVCLTEANNPIKQDVKKGKLRFFTYGDLPFNYGCIPQTWENPNHAHPDTGLKGDSDPVDVVEVSRTPLALGSVSSIKVKKLLPLTPLTSILAI